MILFSIDIVKLIGNTFVEYCQNCQKPFPKLETTHLEFGKIFSSKIWHVEVLVTCRVLAAATREMCMRSSAKRNVLHDATRSSSAVAGAWIAPRLACWLFVTTRAVQAHGLASHRLHTCADTITAPCTPPDHQFSNRSSFPPLLFP
jgi:hypothetical protein